MTRFPDAPAWDFITRLYAAPGVAPACLELQDRHAIDVTLMLFCLWQGTVRAEPLGGRIADLIGQARDWHGATILPIRSARRRLKAGHGALAEAGEALYRTVLAAEIDCEHAEVLILSAAADAFGPQDGGGPFPAAMVANLRGFLSGCGIATGAADIAALATILAAAGAGAEAARFVP